MIRPTPPLAVGGRPRCRRHRAHRLRGSSDTARRRRDPGRLRLRSCQEGRRHAHGRHAPPADRLAGLPRPAGVRRRRPRDQGDQRRRRRPRQAGREGRHRLGRHHHRHRHAVGGPPALEQGRRHRRRRVLRRLAVRHRQDHGRGRGADLAGEHLGRVHRLPRQGPVLPHRPAGRAPGPRPRRPDPRRRQRPRSASSALQDSYGTGLAEQRREGGHRRRRQGRRRRSIYDPKAARLRGRGRQDQGRRPGGDRGDRLRRDHEDHPRAGQAGHRPGQTRRSTSSTATSPTTSKDFPQGTLEGVKGTLPGAEAGRRRSRRASRRSTRS